MINKPGENTQPKVTGTITSDMAPAPYTPGVPNAPELDDNIIAAPLMQPQFTNVPLKNPTLVGRWINFKAGDGLRYQQCSVQGWRNATKADIKDNYASPYVQDGGTKYVNGDTILMVIDKNKYLGALKYKDQMANYLANRHTGEAKRRVDGQLSEAGANTPQNRGKIESFVPGGADLSRLGGSDAGDTK